LVVLAVVAWPVAFQVRSVKLDNALVLQVGLVADPVFLIGQELLKDVRDRFDGFGCFHDRPCGYRFRKLWPTEALPVMAGHWHFRSSFLARAAWRSSTEYLILMPKKDRRW